jgi:hypothetical protein
MGYCADDLQHVLSVFKVDKKCTALSAAKSDPQIDKLITEIDALERVAMWMSMYLPGEWLDAEEGCSSDPSLEPPAKEPWRPIEVAMALSLYAYNVAADKRARSIWNHFQGDCADICDLLATMRSTRVAFAATELAAPSAAAYVEQALEVYGEEARERCRANGV